MSMRQRLIFLVLAVVIAVGAVVLLSGSGDSTEQADAPTATPTPTATAAAGETATPEPQEAEPAAPLLTPASEQDVEATEGDEVVLRVRAPEDDEVHVHGYDIERELPAGKTVTLRFKATITGIFEIELHHSGAALGRLKVNPR
jgi:pyruvate/2-oxoglutarate dehydrogenase complex dihydrolipoamide acyltransferase (E2) component